MTVSDYNKENAGSESDSKEWIWPAVTSVPAASLLPVVRRQSPVCSVKAPTTIKQRSGEIAKELHAKREEILRICHACGIA